MNRRPLSLSAYLALVRGGASSLEDLPARPEGPLVWAYGARPEQARALASLGQRFRQQFPDVQVALTGCDAPGGDFMPVPLPPEKLGACESFVQHLQPDVVLWAGQDLRPAVLSCARDRGARLILLDAQDRPWQVSVPKWFPDPAPAALRLFDTLYSTDSAAARRLRRLGVDHQNIRRGAALVAAQPPLACDDALYEEAAEKLAGRPMWLAAHLRASEMRDVLYAHRQAVRLAHRLVLIIVPEHEEEALNILDAAKQAKLRVCNWDMGETPDENTQVLLTEGPEEIGLWYRMAPLVFLGGSLAPGIGGHDPFEAAAQGAAILYGPHVGQYLPAYSLLAGAGAARIVRDGDSLASAVSNLVAPDLAATMAHAGWEVISSGAEMEDKVISEISDHIDKKALA
ncbi:MAG: 3-deoxy-D-manno-octulosonic acid transferase [Pelagimonas sp.]|nr:3-deoxy-D-manno-octulosonic acid transferase [Pelagimonas sp.]